MVAEAVSDRLDQTGAFAVTGCGNGLSGSGAHRHHVAAIDLLAGESCGDSFLRQRFGTGLQSQRHRYGPLIVGGDEHDGQLVHAGKIHRFVEIAFRGGAIAKQAHGDTRLLAQLECIGDAGGMRRVRSHGNAGWKIVERTGGAIALFVPAPKQQNLFRLDAAPKQRAIVAIRGQQHVFFPHRTGYPDRYRLLAERNGISSKPAGALQCNSLLVKEPQQNHGPVKRDEHVGIGGEGGERPGYRAVWRKVTAMAHLKARNHGEILVYPSAGHALTPGAILSSISYSVGVCAETLQDGGWSDLMRALLPCRFAGIDHTIVETRQRRRHRRPWQMIKLSCNTTLAGSSAGSPCRLKGFIRRTPAKDIRTMPIE